MTVHAVAYEELKVKRQNPCSHIFVEASAMLRLLSDWLPPKGLDRMSSGTVSPGASQQILFLIWWVGIPCACIGFYESRYIFSVVHFVWIGRFEYCSVVVLGPSWDSGISKYIASVPSDYSGRISFSFVVVCPWPFYIVEVVVFYTDVGSNTNAYAVIISGTVIVVIVAMHAAITDAR